MQSVNISDQDMKTIESILNKESETPSGIVIEREIEDEPTRSSSEPKRRRITDRLSIKKNGIDNVYNDKERSIGKNEKRITWSKVWLAITGILFLLDLISCIILVNLNTNVLDTTVMVTSITVTGAIFGSNLCWYSKKSASENHYKLRMAMYEDVVNQRLYFTEEMLKLKQKYKASDEDIAEIDGEGEIASLMDEAFSSMNGKLNQEQDEYEAPNDIQTFNL